MKNQSKKVCSFMLWFMMFSFCILQLNFNLKLSAQNKGIDIQSINKYFNRDLPDSLFDELSELGKKLMTQQTALKEGRDKDIWVIRADGRSEPFPLTIDDKWDDEMPNWSPDNQYIVYVSNQSGNKKIWRMKSDGAEKKQLTKGNSPDEDPLYSPDGRQVAFIRNENLFLIEIKNLTEQQISQKIRIYNICAWSRDGKNILVVVKEQGDQSKLVEIDLAMKDLKEVNLQVDLHILWSNLSLCPDRDFVVFESFEIDNYDIVIENLKEKRLLKLTTDLSHERHPRWSNKGDLIVFSSNRKTPRPDEIKW